MQNPTIAQTILQQLGGTRFAVMTGSKNFVGGSNFLQFSVGRGTKNKANKVKITLEASDLYTLEFFSVRGVNVKQCGDAVRDVYADKLQAAFTEATGFYTNF